MTYHRVCNKRNTTNSTFKEELHTLPCHLISPTFFSRVSVTRSLVYIDHVFMCLVDRCLSFFAIVVSAVPRFRASDHPSGIFKLFCWIIYNIISNRVIITSITNDAVTVAILCCDIVQLPNTRMKYIRCAMCTNSSTE